MKFTDNFPQMENYIKILQGQICQGLETQDTKKFQRDEWLRPDRRLRACASLDVFVPHGSSLPTRNCSPPD